MPRSPQDSSRLERRLEGWKKAFVSGLRANRNPFGPEQLAKTNLQYAALRALRRLPLDPGNPAFLYRAVQGHALEILSELSTKDPYAVAMALGKHAEPGGLYMVDLHCSNDRLSSIALLIS
ncbi:unnamed protein product [Prunus armeniaca]